MKFAFFLFLIVGVIQVMAEVPSLLTDKSLIREYFPYTSSKKPIEIIKKDINKDGKIDRVETVYQDPEHDLLIIRIEVDSTFKGFFDKTWTTTSKLHQKKDELPCQNESSLKGSSLSQLVKDVQAIKPILTKDFISLDLGYKIHQSCLDKWGEKKFPELLSSSIKKAFLCLDKLAKDNAKNNPNLPNGALSNLNGIQSLLEKSGVSVVCNEKDYNWSHVAAHASTSPSQIIAKAGVKHPYISVNVEYPKNKRHPTQEEANELYMTLFHEQFHNLGLRHGDDLEFSYSCETCCLKDENSKETEKADSCKICSGAYEGITDKNYIKDLITWGKSSGQSEFASKAIVKYEQEFPHDRFGLFAYADASADIFSPVGIELGKILKQKMTKITAQEAIFLKNSEKYIEVDNLKAAAPYAKLVAESHFSLYYEKDPKKVLTLLDKNKEMILDLMKRKVSEKGNEKYIYEDIHTRLKDLLTNIWMENYPKNSSPENQQAYDLLNSLGEV